MDASAYFVLYGSVSVSSTRSQKAQNICRLLDTAMVEKMRFKVNEIPNFINL